QKQEVRSTKTTFSNKKLFRHKKISTWIIISRIKNKNQVKNITGFAPLVAVLIARSSL
ncbi:unnamed protein product, partial [Amoebophrya sp. A120]